MKERITPEKIEKLEDNQIFVLGSNLSAIYGAGAARTAIDKKWIHYDQRKGYGLMLYNKKGCFAVPTKGFDIENLPLEIIEYFIKKFIQEAVTYPWFTFLVTELGCGLGNKTPKEIAPLFKEAVNVPNIHLPQRFWDVLNKKE